MPCLKYYNRLTEKWEPLGLTLQVVDAEGTSATDCIKYSPQNLTEEQKAQARENIGASSLTIMETAGGLVLTENS